MKGFSLIEMSIALTLGMIMLLGGYAGLQALEYHFTRQQVRLEQQNNQQLALQLLQQATAAAGLGQYGHLEAADYFINVAMDDTEKVNLLPEAAIQVYHDPAALRVPTKAIMHSDILVTRQASDQNVILANAISKGSEQLVMSNHLLVAENDMIVLTDGEHSVAERVSAVRNHGGLQDLTFAQPLPVDMASGTRVQLFYWFAYYIGKTDRYYSDGQSVTALYVQDHQNRRYELVPDITQLQIVPVVTGWQIILHVWTGAGQTEQVIQEVI